MTPKPWDHAGKAGGKWIVSNSEQLLTAGFILRMAARSSEWSNDIQRHQGRTRAGIPMHRRHERLVG
jgi:hypothetical protein